MKQDNELDRIENGTHPTTSTTRTKSNTTPRGPLPTGGIIGIAVAIAVVTGIGGFAAGMQFQKGTASSTLSQQGGPGGNNGFGNMSRNGSFGTITAVSDSSITITPMQGGPNSSSSSTTATDKTYTINSSTTISVDGSTASASDLATGDTVMIQTSSSDSTVATSIRSGMGGMMNPGGTQQSSNGSSDTQTRTN